MIESVALAGVLGYLIKSAPSWLNDLRSVLVEKGKKSVTEQGKKLTDEYIDQKKQVHHLELALKNAAEQGLIQFETLQERDQYRHILTILSEPGSHSDTLRREVMRLFVISGEPHLEELNEIYNRSLRIRMLNQENAPEDVDVSRYLLSFFKSLVAELYKDPLFREQISDVLKVRTAIDIHRSLNDVVAILRQIGDTVASSYTTVEFEQDIHAYLSYLERTLHYTKLITMIRQDRNNNIDPELDGIFIPLKITSSHHTHPKELVATNSLISLLERNSYVVLLGGPGSGKSISTRHLAWSHAVANLVESTKTPRLPLLSGTPLPLRIELRRFVEDRRHQPELNFLTYASEILLRQENIVIHTQMFEELLERRVMLLLFDGLDEVATLDERKRLIEEIEHFTMEYPGNRILVTSRPIGYEFAQFSNRWFYHAQIQEFDRDQIHLYLKRWYLNVLRLDPLPHKDLQERESLYTTLVERSRLFALAKNPLLLTVITALHRARRLPDRRVLVYEECTKVMLEIWSQFRGTDKQWKDLLMTEEDQYACIAHLGYILHTKSQKDDEQELSVTNDETEDIPSYSLLKEIEQVLEKQNLFSSVAERRAETKLFFKMITMEAGLIVETGTNEVGDKLFGFVHRTFQEYFAAMDIYERYQREDISIISNFLQTYLFDPHWHEVILLLLGKLKRKPVTSQLFHILDRNNKNSLSDYLEILHNDLFFVHFCLTEEISVENQLAEQVIQHLSHLALMSTFPSQRKEALIALRSLINTRQYAQLSKDILIGMIDKNTIDDLAKIQIISIAYFLDIDDATLLRMEQLLIQLITSSNMSFSMMTQTLLEPSWQFDDIEKHQKIETILCDLASQPTIAFDDALSFYKGIPEYSDLSYPPTKFFLMLLKRQDLTFEQKVDIAKSLYMYIGEQTEEITKLATNILIELVHEKFITDDQRALAAMVLFQCSATDWKGEQIAVQILSELLLQSHIKVELIVHIIKYIYNTRELIDSLPVVHILEELLKQPNSSFEKTLLINEVLCQIKPFNSEIHQHVLERILQLSRQENITIEQYISAISIFIDNSFPQSEERKQAIQNLVTLLRLPNLSIDQLIYLAQVLYKYSSSDESAFSVDREVIMKISFEEELRERLRQVLGHPDLPFTQNVSILDFLYKEKVVHHFFPTPYDESDNSDESNNIIISHIEEFIVEPTDRKIAWETISQLLQKQKFTNEQRLQLLTIPLSAKSPTFTDLSYSIRLICSMMPEETAKKYLKENIQTDINNSSFGLRHDLKTSDTTVLIEILQQELVPMEIRNFAYEQLRKLFPFYWDLDRNDNDALGDLDDNPF